MTFSSLYTKITIYFLLLCLLSGAFFIRSGQFRGCGLYRDEPGTNTLAFRSISEYIYPEHGAEPIEINGIFYYKFIQHPWQEFCCLVLGDITTSAYRFSSLIGGILSLWALFHLGKRCSSIWISLLAVALLSINGCHQYYSNYLRYHIFSLLAAILLTIILFNILAKPNIKNWLLYIVMSAVNIGISLNNITLLPAHWLILSLAIKRTSTKDPARVRLKSGLIASILTALATALPMPFFDRGALARMDSYPELSWQLGVNIFCSQAGLKEYLYSISSIVTLLSILIFLIAGLYRAWQEYHNKGDLLYLTLAAWLVVPLLLHVILSILIQPLIITRNLIFIMPAFALLTAIGINYLSSLNWHKLIITAAWVIIIHNLLLQCGHNVFYEWDEPVNYRYFQPTMTNCCRFPGDHIKLNVFANSIETKSSL
ncbi:MAG: hypothetical protein ACI376_01815 [Candidatus Bruticola sp.]